VGDPAYYARFGFEAAAGLDLPGVPAKYLLAQSLGAGRPRGTLAYHEAFGIQA
jgi:putative acetyltransferase